jgi:Integrase core domain/Integrase zinc binding domain
VRKAPLDGCEQILVPRSLRPIVLHLEHHQKSIGHPGVTKMFATMRKRYFGEICTRTLKRVRQCTPCAKNRVQERKRVSMMKMFPANEPPEFVAIDILGPLPKTVHGNRFLLVILDRFSKLTRTIPMRTTTSLAVSKAFCTHWCFAYGPPTFLLSDNGTQFTAKFFIELCRELGIAKVFTTAYSPQTNGQVDRFNRTILNASRTYVANSQTDWDYYTAAITFGYNSRVHASLGYSPFMLVLSRPPPSLTMESPIGNAAEFPEGEKRRFVERLKELVPLAKDRLLESQRLYKENFDLHTRVANEKISPESWVFLRREVADPNGSSKLDELTDGPYRVVKSEGHTLVLRIGDDDVRVSNNRLTQAPKPLAAVPIAGDSPIANPMGNIAPPTGNDPIPTGNYSP